MKNIESPFVFLSNWKIVEDEIGIQKRILLSVLDNVIDSEDCGEVLGLWLLSVDGLSHRSLTNDVQRTETDRFVDVFDDVTKRT